MKIAYKFTPEAWSLPLSASHFGWKTRNFDGISQRGHCIAVRVLCFGIFFEWSR